MSSALVSPESGPKPLSLLQRHPGKALVAAAAAWHALLHLGAGAARASGNGAELSAWALAPLLLLPVWAVWRSIALLSEEGVGGPPPSRALLFVHLGRIALQMLGFAALVSLSAYGVFHRAMGLARLAEALPLPAVDWFFRAVISGELLLIGGIVLFLPLVQLGFVLSRMSGGYRRLIHLWTCVLLVWIVLRVGPYLAALLPWLPDVTFRQIASAGPRFRFIFAGIETAPFAATFLLSLLALVAASLALPVARETVQNPPPKSRWSEPIVERRPVTPREKILLTLMAVSFLSLIDIGTSGRQVLRDVPGFYLQPPRASAITQLLTPFVVDAGTLSEPQPAFDTLVIRTEGDLLVVPSSSGELRADYALWTLALNAEEALRYGEQADVVLQQSGATAELVLHAPPAQGDRGRVRASYRLELPPGIALRVNGSGAAVSIFRTEGDIEIALASGLLQVSDVLGSLKISGERGDLYLSNVAGNVEIRQRDGVAEIHGVGGALDLDGEYLTVSVSDVAGPVAARIRRGAGSFAHLRQGLSLAAEMAEVSVGAVEGPIEYGGAISPARFAPVSGPAALQSDRGNVVLRLDAATPWDLKLSSTGAIASSLPEEVAVVERSGRTTSLEGSLGGGGVPLSAVVKGAGIRVELF